MDNGSKQSERSWNKQKRDGKPFEERKRSDFGGKKPYGAKKTSDRQGMSGEKKSYGDKKPFGGKSGSGERKSFDRQGMSGEKKSYGDKKPFGGKPDSGKRKPYGDQKSFERKGTPAGTRNESEKSASARAKGASPARVAALEALLAVGREGSYSGLALDRVLKKNELSDSDRRLCTELFYGCLEKRLYLDYALKPYLRRPFDDEVMDEILRMAVYQNLFLDRIPDNAICSEAVELVRLRGREALCPVANGILRSFMRREGDIPMPQDPVTRLSLETSTPLWLIEALQEQMGLERAEQFLRSPAQRSITLRPNLVLSDKQALCGWLDEKNYEWEPSALEDAVNVRGGGLATSPAFLQGQYAIIGEASMLACRALGVKNGWRVLDACAAPGGKSCYIGELMANTGRVTAMDIHPHRVELIAAYAKRMHLDNVRPRVADAANPDEFLRETMDAALVDAPCSGLGVLHSKPDIKYGAQPDSIEKLPETQLAILSAAADTVKPGGVLVYSTCTVLKRENADVVAAFLEKHPEFTLEGLEKQLPAQFASRVENSMIQLMPDQDGTDGFFIARMVKAGRRR